MTPPRLLLLTDFTPLSALAIEYAIRLAGPLNADFTIMNVVRLEGIPKANLKMKSLEKSIMHLSEEEGMELVKKIRREIKGNYTLRFEAVKAHTVADAVTRFVSKQKVNMVVMGSRGASTLKKIRLGGTTVAVIDACPVPVLAIPEFAEFSGLKNIVYATDLKHVHRELDIITEFAAIFGSRVHMVTVMPALNKQAMEDKQQAEEIVNNHPYKRLDFNVILDEHIPGAIDRYIRDTKSDLLTTFTHNLSLEEKLFAKSVTRKLAYLGKIPLLAVKRQ
ncbi:MAG: universal stress protein [Cyclobacteriaceae bacterium]|jgi:nucleotide-binding universal stress UspA family protein|nr:universal stress protein [Cyclobacteriaceae bacterium]